MGIDKIGTRKVGQREKWGTRRKVRLESGLKVGREKEPRKVEKEKSGGTKVRKNGA